MHGEPSAYEYAQMIGDANKRISTNGFSCSHNNLGWLGYFITTPKGNKYQLVKKTSFGDTGYYLCEHNPRSYEIGLPLGLDFCDLEECKKYLAQNE